MIKISIWGMCISGAMHSLWRISVWNITWTQFESMKRANSYAITQWNNKVWWYFCHNNKEKIDDVTIPYDDNQNCSNKQLQRKPSFSLEKKSSLLRLGTNGRRKLQWFSLKAPVCQNYSHSSALDAMQTSE